LSRMTRLFRLAGKGAGAAGGVGCAFFLLADRDMGQSDGGVVVIDGGGGGGGTNGGLGPAGPPLRGRGTWPEWKHTCPLASPPPIKGDRGGK
jgi:hypothetical protein